MGMTVQPHNAAAMPPNISGPNDPATFWKMSTIFLLCVLVLITTGTMEFRESHRDITVKDYANGTQQLTTGTVSTKTNPNGMPSASPITKAPDGSQTPNINNNNNNNQQPGKEINVAKRSFGTTYSGDPGRWQYFHRGATYYSDAELHQFESTWGRWEWENEPQRPKEDFYKEYPNRDVPWKDFPDNAWQNDKDYVEKMLKQGKKLVVRTMEAILAEYGHGQKSYSPKTPIKERAAMFQLNIFDDDKLDTVNKENTYFGRGGWTTKSSWEGLKQRMLHAIITEDSFNFAMGGHSSAAGHGNHFQQSYTLQVAWIMEPVFARLGVRHSSRNFGNGGLGTGHNGIAAGVIYGDNSVVMWDSGMTEKGNREPDLFARQALIGGPKVPVLLNFPKEVLQKLHKLAGVHIGIPGGAGAGVEQANTKEQLDAQPFAAQALKCGPSIKKDFCKNKEYSGKCWIDRPDFTPKKLQSKIMPGRTSWHPGYKQHQAKGRVLAFTLLTALEEIIDTWSKMEDFRMPESAWHVSSLYEETRKKVLEISPEDSPCYGLGDAAAGYEKMCYLPMKGRTEFTPRANPEHTSIRAIMPKEALEHLNPPPKSAYDPPDVFNPKLYPPKEAVNALTLAEGGAPFRDIMDPIYAGPDMNQVSGLPIVKDVGKGTYLDTRAGYCDGTLYSWCARGENEDCLLRSHNDGRHGLLIDGKSGWLVLNIPKVQHGYIVLKIETWHKPQANKKTSDWKTVNNEPGYPGITEMGGEDCKEYTFDYTIDDRPMVSLTPTEFMTLKFEMQRVVELFTVLDDPSYAASDGRDIQLKMRITGCAWFKLTHVYWA